MDNLARLLEEHAADTCRAVLVCAPDVWEAVRKSGAPAGIIEPLEWDVRELTQVGVIIAHGYEPGRWKLIRHDHCSGPAEPTLLGSMVVQHGECTIVARWPEPAECSRCSGLTDEPRQASELCAECGPDTPLCPPCYAEHAREVVDDAEWEISKGRPCPVPEEQLRRAREAAAGAGS